MKTIVPEWMKPIYEAHHFAPAVLDGEVLRCSGMVGLTWDLQVPAEPKEQFTLAFANAHAVLAEAGLSFADVTEITSYHVGLTAHLEIFTEVKDDYVHEPYPAWTAVGVTELAVPGALVEIQITARAVPPSLPGDLAQ
jgi:enamine deaminase RidA (YjgF/YER057c/UK114 family)